MHRLLRVFRADSVSARLLVAFVLVSIAPVVVAGVLVYRAVETTLREELGQRLGTVTQLRAQQIDAWINDKRQDVVRPASYPQFRREVAALVGAKRPEPARAADLREALEQIRIAGGYVETLIVRTSDGTVAVSTDPREEGTDKRDRPYFREALAKAFVQPVFRSPILRKPVLAFAVPVLGPNGTPIAILVGRADLTFLEALMAERTGLGTTGRTFLVNSANIFVAATPAAGHDTTRGAASGGIKRALAGETGTALYTSHDGHEVVGAFRPVPDIGLALVAEMDIHEAFAPIQRFRIAIVALFVIVSIGAALIGVRLALGISRPIERLAEAASALGEGKLDHRVDVGGPVEVTALARAFNGMAEDLSRSRGDLMAHSTALEGKVTDRTRNLTALLEVTQALGSTLDLTETLWCAARSLVRILRADAGVAYVLDDGTTLRPVAGYQLPPSLRGATDRTTITVKAHELITDACDSHVAVFVQDSSIDRRVDRTLLALWDFRSVLFVPMFSGGRLVGGLFAGWRESRPELAQEELNLIDGIGRQAGIAVQNAALFTDSERRRRVAETLAELDAVLAGSLDLKVVAEGIVRGARALLDSKLASVYRLDPVNATFELLAADGEIRDHAPTLVPQGGGISSMAVAQRAILTSADVLDDARFAVTPDIRARVEKLGAPAMAAAPLRVADQVIGVLCIHDARGREFTTDETRVLRTFASQAALALENARLYDDAQARAARMIRLGEFGRMISSSLDLREVLDRVAGAARELLDADLARVWVAHPDERVVRLMASQDRSGAQVAGSVTELPLGVGVVGFVMTERHRHYSPELSDDASAGEKALKDAGYTSRLAVPLIVSDRAVGVLTILTKVRRAFRREDEEIAELFASEAATAVENARLFADTEAQAAVLAKKNAELDAFAYSVSHDLKAPLVTIQAMCGMLMEDQGDRLDDDGRRVLKRVEANATHMAQLISDLLALSRIGRDARTPEMVPIQDVVEAVLDRQSGMIRERGVEVVCDADVTVWGVRVHIEQVFANLVSNAIKYLGPAEKPRVEIRADENGSRFVEFSVRDNGIGIDPAYHARIFELFQRLRDVEAEGTGVGLALVKKIIDTAGGRIWVESAPGEGATFRFTWPASATVRAA